jgi:hypothetical protein
MAPAFPGLAEQPISRIRETCEMMGVRPKFDRALPELETYLESQVATARAGKHG